MAWRGLLTPWELWEVLGGANGAAKGGIWGIFISRKACSLGMPSARWPGSRVAGSSADSPGKCPAGAGVQTGGVRTRATWTQPQTGSCRPLQGRVSSTSPPHAHAGCLPMPMPLQASPNSLPRMGWSFQSTLRHCVLGSRYLLGRMGSYQAVSRRRCV